MEQLKMNFITNTSHDSKIYCKDGEKFINVIEKLAYKYKKEEE